MVRAATDDFADPLPDTEVLSDYDRRHLKLYARLLDADTEGAPVGEVVKVLFGFDAATDPERAERLHSSHLKRARWMAENGYRQLLAGQ